MTPLFVCKPNLLMVLLVAMKKTLRTVIMKRNSPSYNAVYYESALTKVPNESVDAQETKNMLLVSWASDLMEKCLLLILCSVCIVRFIRNVC